MNRETAILITLILYKVCLVGIGLYYHRRTRSGVDFYLGGRQLGPWVAAISASASSSSAWTLLGVSGAAYAWGLSAVWLFPSCVGGFFVNWYILAPALGKLGRDRKALTVTEILAGPPGTPLRKAVTTVASMIILASLGTYVASQFQGAGKTFSETFGISTFESILIGSAIVVFYTLLGGFWAVSVTDTLQGILMALTAIVLPTAAVVAVGGFPGFVDGLSALGGEGYLSLTRNLPPVAALGFIFGLLGIGLGYPGQPHVVNRFMALIEGSDPLKRARRIAMLWAVLVYAGMLLVGFCGRILLPDVGDPEVVFIALTTQLFHPVLAGVMVAAVLSAIMSTADSQLLVASSTVTHDLRLAKSSSLSMLAQSRIVVFLISSGAVLAAVLGSKEIFSQVLFAWAAMGSAFGPLLLVESLKGRVEPRVKLAAMVTGFVLSVGAFYLFPAGALWKGSFERFFPFVVVLVIAFMGYRLNRRDSA